MVRTAGCDQIQGWLYYRAMPADQIVDHLNSQTAANQAAHSITKGAA
jgi:EAL domain-containing protein (putative c-di-GMP-specific phosphodiesterase class I)